MSSSPRPASAGASYDAVPYEGHAIQSTSPDAMAVMGTLFGLRPAAVETCRVLELGCGSGSNLAAMALPLPDARFVGIDASPRQIEIGRDLMRAIGAGNVELSAGDLRDLPEEIGPFDYIVCHGVYSWVAPPVQERILEIFARRLAPQGIAYLSYNTYPGCHLRDMAREMMRFHVRHLEDSAQSTEQARALIAFLKRFAYDRRGEYAKILENVEQEVSVEPDWYVFHEYLEEHNAPVYFWELAERAAGKALQYLAPSVFNTWEHNLPAELEEGLGRFTNRIVREQYLDFLCNRKFRKTLFCRAGVPVLPHPRPETVAALSAVARARPAAPGAEARGNGVGEFEAVSGERLSTNRPLVKTILAALAELAPRAVPVSSMWPIVSGRLVPGEDAAASPDEIPQVLLRLQLSNLVELRTWTPDQPLSASERPQASPLARLQAAGNRPVVNLRHESRNLLDFDRAVLPLLDGTRDRPALREALLRALRDDAIHIEDSSGTRLEDPEKASELVALELEKSLERFAGGCFLTG